MTIKLDEDKIVDGIKFKEWYDKVNVYVMSKIGLGIDDLPDGPSWDSWEGGMSPEDYGDERLREEGYSDDEEG